MNTSQLSWVDVTTGEQLPFTSCRPSLAGAALVGADAARDLLARRRVEERPGDRGPLPLPLGLLLAALAGLVAGGTAGTWTRSGLSSHALLVRS